MFRLYLPFSTQPTSGLDARSALLVVKLLRKISDEGRTICCTIHQPSSGEPKITFLNVFLILSLGNTVLLNIVHTPLPAVFELFVSKAARALETSSSLDQSLTAHDICLLSLRLCRMIFYY